MFHYKMAGRQACCYIPLAFAFACAAAPAHADLQVAQVDA